MHAQAARPLRIVAAWPRHEAGKRAFRAARFVARLPQSQPLFLSKEEEKREDAPIVGRIFSSILYCFPENPTGREPSAPPEPQVHRACRVLSERRVVQVPRVLLAPRGLRERQAYRRGCREASPRTESTPLQPTRFQRRIRRRSSSLQPPQV